MKHRDWNTRPKPQIGCEELAARLRKEDSKFDKQWRKYWQNRSKWANFEEFLKQAV